MKTLKSALPPLNRIKQRAKQLKKSNSISQTQAYEQLSKEYGYNSWREFKSELVEKEEADATAPPPPSLDFVGDSDIEMSEDDFKSLDEERSEPLNDDVKHRVLQNKKELTKLGIEFSIFEPTATGLKKSILDATQPVRSHFEIENFHFFEQQGQGPQNKSMTQAYLVTRTKSIESQASLYRPNTKKGDPRMWFSKLKLICQPGDQIAIVIYKSIPYLFNLSDLDLHKYLKLNNHPISELLITFSSSENYIADELIGKLRQLAGKPLPAMRSGSTGIGYTLETMLGIDANSSKEPDYKGIEIKSGRSSSNRTTLFAQVADWSISPCKKSSEVLNKYGYERGDDFKLYCTVSTQRENSQGLSFVYDESNDELQEWYKKRELVAVWPGDLLRRRLKQKHTETFWVHAESLNIDGEEHFILKSITHTRSPLLSQLLPLIQSGIVTMDHLIKRKGDTGRVSEKGPLFKMNKRDLELLFPEPIIYSLVEEDKL